MKASDLKIGNLVEISEEHKNEIYSYFETEIDYPKENYFEVASISRDEANIYFAKEEFEFELSDLKPIKLTEDWLLKFNFELKRKGDIINKWVFCDFVITFNKRINIFTFTFSLPEIKYIHQLQNLYFALTTEELTL